MSSLTPAAAFAWKIAAAEAGEGKHPLIEEAHLLMGALSLDKVVQLDAAKLGLSEADFASIRAEQERLQALLGRHQLQASVVRRTLRERVGAGSHVHAGSTISRSPRCKAAFARAQALAAGDVTALHFVAALLESEDPVLAELLGGSRGLALLRADARVAALGDDRPAAPPAPAGTPTLDRHGRDLTALAARGDLGPLIGRRDEMLQLVQTLARQSKNNPVLVGEAGVGKTALVEGLAQRVAQGKDPVLAGKRIVELSVGSLVAGTRLRGEFEERLTRIIAEAKAHPEVIVFVDELHTVVGAGRTSDSAMDAADLMKPALARGDLRCIGATTQAEYRRWIESDPALERRFERVVVGEPGRDEALDILRGLRERWQAHHGVRIDDTALEAAVDLSLRYDTDHQLPDKAIDLVDKACAAARVPVLSMQPGDAPSTDAAEPVTELAVARVFAEKVGVPLELVTERLSGVRRPRLMELEGFLKGRLIGQDGACDRVVQRLKLAHAGMSERRGPLSSLMFLGPSGVGKTQMAKLLAEFLFGNASELLRFDMSEYGEEHSVSKLIGAPPGYLGHDEDSQLVAKLRARPYTVLLLDEIEKAHPRVYDVLLQLLGEGRLTDSKGRTADARHAIVVMTSNLGEAARGVGFAKAEEAARPEAAVIDEVRKHFRPEFVGRIDEMVVFRPLGEGDALRILGPMLEEIWARLLEQHGVNLAVDPEAAAFIARSGTSPAHGVRELKRALEKHLEGPLSNLILSGKIAKAKRWRAAYEEGAVWVIPA